LSSNSLFHDKLKNEINSAVTFYFTSSIHLQYISSTSPVHPLHILLDDCSLLFTYCSLWFTIVHYCSRLFTFLDPPNFKSVILPQQSNAMKKCSNNSIAPIKAIILRRGPKDFHLGLNFIDLLRTYPQIGKELGLPIEDLKETNTKLVDNM